MIAGMIITAFIACLPLVAWWYFRRQVRRMAAKSKLADKPCERAINKAAKMHDSCKITFEDEARA